MNLKEELLRGIYAYGFEKPSAIQQRAIVPCIKVSDVFFCYRATGIRYHTGTTVNISGGFLSLFQCWAEK